jgi:hypothetical protein
MKKVEVRAAQPIGTQVIVPVQITISGYIKTDLKADLSKVRGEFEKDAQLLFDALRDTLPGGTFDRLLGLMLAEKASHFVVRH